MSKKFTIIIFLILLNLAIFLRVIDLDKYPPSLNWDEISLGYNAYSILNSGKDEWGNDFPLTFRAYGDYKLPGYVYLSVPFISTLGLNEWGVRLLSAISGVGTVVLIFFILKQISTIPVALWGMFLAAILPWGIILSRIALEANLALFLTTASIWAFLKGLRNSNLLILSAVLLGLSIFTYNSSRVIAPLIIISCCILFRRELIQYRLQILISLVIFIVFFTIAVPLAILSDSSARYRWTTILDEGAIQQINTLRGESNLPDPFKRLAYNKVNYFASHAFSGYIAHFDPKFLFFTGGSHYQYSIPGQGLLYPIFMPLLILGLIFAIKKRDPFNIFLLAFLAISPIPASITRDSPHALRSLMMILPLIMLSAIGVDYFIKLIKSQKIIFVLIILFALSFWFFWQNYTGEYPKKYSWAWQYGYKEAVDYISTNYDKYDSIIVTKKYGEPHEFVLFYMGWDPKRFGSDPNLVRFQRSDWYWVDRFDKFYFVNDWQIPKETDEPWVMESGGKVPVYGRILLVSSPENHPDGWKRIKIINFLDGKEAFEILEKYD